MVCNRFYLWMLLLVFIAGCSVNPVTGEKELSLISASQEVAIGEKNYLPYQQQQGGRYQVDPDLNFYINQVGQKLARVSQRAGLPYEFVVLNNGTPNAWALPGGKIAINRGLLLLLEDEAQLAAVLGHEVVHAAARHSAQQMTRGTLLGIGVQAAGIAGRNSQYGGLIATGANLGAGAFQARYGRSQELQADSFGIDYMVAAGYDPMAAVELQQTFVELSKNRQSNWLSALFASHPPSQERVDKNRAKVETLPRRGVRNKQAYQRAIAQIKQDAPAYAALDKAMQFASKKEFNQALTQISEAIQLQPEEALFYTAKGQILLAQKQDKSALSAFTTAAKRNPEYFLGFLGQGVIQKKLGRAREAKSNLERSVDLLPTQIATYHLGEIALTKGQKDKAIQYFQQTAKGGGELGKAAQAHLNKLVPVQPQPAQ